MTVEALGAASSWGSLCASEHWVRTPALHLLGGRSVLLQLGVLLEEVQGTLGARGPRFHEAVAG